MKFVKGELVRLVDDLEAFGLNAGRTGDVVAVDLDDSSYATVCVAFNGYSDGHDGDTGEDRSDCRWVHPAHLCLIAPDAPICDDAAELAEVLIRLDADNFTAITRMAKQCGLTPDQMASALFVMAYHTTLKPIGEAA